MSLALAAATVLAATALAACGDDDAAASASSEARPTLRLGYFPNITHAPALVGVENGHLRRQTLGDIKLETKTFNAGPSAIEALFSGAIDATYIGPNPAINGWAQSKGDGAEDHRRHHLGRRRPGGQAGASPPRHDLKGKKIATPQLGNTQDVALRHWLKETGLHRRPAGRRRRLGAAAGQRDGRCRPSPRARSTAPGCPSRT